jgi:cytochrome c oxidase cbb3-type subunit 3
MINHLRMSLIEENVNWEKISIGGAFTVLLFAVGSTLTGQAPPPARGGRAGGTSAAFPQRSVADPASLERGKALYGVNCNFCHGSDARGGEGGPNLLRSELVLQDQKGERIGAVVRNGRPDQGMPKFNMTGEQVQDLAAFIHSFPVNNRDPARFPPPSILVGDAKAGEAYFQSRCASCHSLTGDLKGIASKIPDPKTLQNTFVMPGGRGPGAGATAPPVTVTIAVPGGAKAEGRLVRIDDFMVTLTGTDGVPRTYRRDGEVPKVEIHDPLQQHRDLLKVYTDKDIHNLTSYLVTVK